MLLRQLLKTRADVMELLDFVQDRFERHEAPLSRKTRLRWEELQMDWLRSEDLKEEKKRNRPNNHYSSQITLSRRSVSHLCSDGVRRWPLSDKRTLSRRFGCRPVYRIAGIEMTAKWC
jgi:hypothetical protein